MTAMNRRTLLASLLSMIAAPAVAAETFDELWDDRIIPTKMSKQKDLSHALSLRHVPATEPFNEKQFDDDVRKRTLTPPPEPEPRRMRRRRRVAYRRRRRHG